MAVLFKQHRKLLNWSKPVPGGAGAKGEPATAAHETPEGTKVVGHVVVDGPGPSARRSKCRLVLVGPNCRKSAFPEPGGGKPRSLTVPFPLVTAVVTPPVLV